MKLGHFHVSPFRRRDPSGGIVFFRVGSAMTDGMSTSEPTLQPIATQPPTVEGPTCNTHTSRREQTANLAAGFVFVVILVVLVAMVVVIVLKLA